MNIHFFFYKKKSSHEHDVPRMANHEIEMKSSRERGQGRWPSPRNASREYTRRWCHQHWQQSLGLAGEPDASEVTTMKRPTRGEPPRWWAACIRRVPRSATTGHQRRSDRRTRRVTSRRRRCRGFKNTTSVTSLNELIYRKETYKIKLPNIYINLLHL